MKRRIAAYALLAIVLVAGVVYGITSGYFVGRYAEWKNDEIERQVIACVKPSEVAHPLGAVMEEDKLIFLFYASVGESRLTFAQMIQAYNEIMDCALVHPEIQAVSMVDHYFEPFMDVADGKIHFELRLASVLIVTREDRDKLVGESTDVVQWVFEEVAIVNGMMEVFYGPARQRLENVELRLVKDAIPYVLKDIGVE